MTHRHSPLAFAASTLAAFLLANPAPAFAAEPTFSSQTGTMITLAEEMYPTLFQNGGTNQTFQDYVYRAYAGGIYVGVKNERLYLLGGPFGSTLSEKGTVGSVLAMLQNARDIQQNTPETGTTFHVNASTGSDTTGDGSRSKPWASIQKAATSLVAGSTILVQPGVYKGPITINTKATEAAPAILKAAGPGVLVDGSGSSRDALFVDNASWVIIDGIKVQKATRAGLRISRSPHVTVRNSAFVDNGTWGIFTDFSDYTTVEDTETARSATQHGVYISNSSDFPVLRRIHAHHNYQAGIHMNGDASAGGDGIVSGGLIESNIIYENGAGGGSGINMDGVNDTTVRNNLLYENHASGISVYQTDGGTPSNNNRLHHNTIVMAANGRWAVNMPETNSRDNKIFNNIIFHPRTDRGAILIGTNNPTGFESDYNVLVSRFSVDDSAPIGSAAWQALGHDQHSIFTTPEAVFALPQNKVYVLKAGSPAVDAAVSLNPPVTEDINGQTRPQGAGADIGAFELPVP